MEHTLLDFAQLAQVRRWPVDSERSFSMTLYIESKSQVFGPCAGWEVAIDERGIGTQTDWSVATRMVNDVGGDHGIRNRMMWSALQTITFMHCRNVRVVSGPALPRKVAEKQTKKLGRPPLQYSVVEIDPFRTRRYRANGGGEGSGRSVRMHTVPGHFAHFGDCCPGVHDPHGLAFGKLTGMFWSPPHVRGDLESGVIIHDYEMTPNARP